MSTEAIAVAISLFSLWHSWHTAKLIRAISASEKRSQAISILLEVLLETQELLLLTKSVTEYKESDLFFPKELIKIEKQLSSLEIGILERLKWIRASHAEHPIKLEEYKTFALEVEARIKKISPMIRELRVQQTQKPT